MSEELLEFIKQQTETMQALVAQITEMKDKDKPNTTQRAMDLLSNSITEFIFDPLNGVTFNNWYAMHEETFTVDANKLDDASKVRLLLRKLDSISHSKYINFILPKKTGEINFVETVEVLKRMFGEPESLFNIRFNCFKLIKKPTDDYITFASTVNKECERFKFNDLNMDQFKCLIFLCGLQAVDKDIRTRLLLKLEKDATINLDKLTAECKKLIDLKSDADLITPKTDNSLVPQVKKISKKFTSKNYQKNKSIPNHSTAPSTSKTSDKSKRPKRPCWFCGDMHWVQECPYKKHICFDCKRTGHKEGFCDSDRSKQRKQKFNQVKGDSLSTKLIEGISIIDFVSKRKFLTVEINHFPIRLQVDTGSDITVISLDTYNELGNPSAMECLELANSASGHKLSLKWEFDCKLGFHGTETSGTCYVSTIPNLNVIGIDWLELLGLFDVPLNRICNQVHKTPNVYDQQKFIDNMKQKFSSVFHPSIGKCTKMKATLRLKSDAKPVFRPKRPVPYAALPIVEATLDRLISEGVLTKVSYSKWAAPTVYTKKPNGSIRMCADFSTGLNDALETYHHPLPTPDSIFATLNGGKYFSKIDFTDAFFQILVDDSSKEYLTINTHRGLFQYNRLPFGIKTASAIFQQVIDAMISGLNRTCGFQDDVMVNGRTIEEHNDNLIALFERIKEWGFHVSMEKCKFFMTQITYLGFIIDEHGRRPDKSNFEAILNMPEPHDVTTVRSFLGMLNYYSQFVKEMRSLRAPLDKLLCKDVKFEWTNECRNSFNRAKEILQSDLLLTHFDPTADIKVAADASEEGLGAVILHHYPDGSEKAIEHASRALTPAEKNYGQIEKEALSIIFAIRKFHKMIWGRKFLLQTDHKPLLAIFGSKKGIPVHASSRLQRWSLILMPYDFNIVHVTSDKFGHADALSRLLANRPLPLETMVVASIQLFEEEINTILVDAIRMLPVTFDMILNEIPNDPVISDVIKFLRTSWPTTINNEDLQIFYNRRDSLLEKNGCLLFNERVVIPSSLRMKIMAHLHVAHPGIVRMKALARSYVYWPNIDKHITDYVKSCSRCASAAKAPVKVQLSSWPKAPEVWYRIHIDYAGPFQGHNYLVVVDSFSKWPEIFIMTSTTTAATIKVINELISRFGVMHMIVSDNGPQFKSHEFDEFCKEQGIVHIPTPPVHPQSNGQAERFVDTFKRALQKAKGEEIVPTVLQKFLQRYRITPNPQLPFNQSPAEIMLGRKMKSTLDLIKPPRNFDLVRDLKMEYDFNSKHGAQPRIFTPKQTVFVRDFRGRKMVWSPAIIIERRGSVIYTVRCDGLIWRRHANQIRPRYNDDGENSDPTLSLLLDTFDLMDQPIDENQLRDLERENEIIPPNEVTPVNSSSTSNIHGRPQRNRCPPIRTNFSKSVRGRYIEY